MNPGASENAGLRIIGEFLDENSAPETREVPAETEAARLDRYFEFCDAAVPHGQPKPSEPQREEAAGGG